MIYDFDEIIERKNTQSSKWDNVAARIGNGDALPMWVADMDFRCPIQVVEAVKKRAEHEIYGYPYVPPEFYEVTASWLKKRHGWEIRSDWVVFTTGIVPVFNTMIQAFTEEGDEVIIQEPVYHQMIHPVKDNGRVISNNALLCENGVYSIDFEDLERRASRAEAKLLFLCSPHNPVGKVWSRQDLVRIAEICLKYGVIIVSDEIHSDLLLFGNRHVPLASIDERYAWNSVSCFAPSKTFNIAGLRASGIVAPNPEIRKKLENQFKKNKGIQQNVFAVPAYIAAYTECDDYLEQLVAYLEKNIAFLAAFLEERMPKIKIGKQEATYLAWLNCKALNLSDEALAEFFIDKSLVGVSLGTAFGDEGSGYVRLNVGCPRRTLEKALHQILVQYKSFGF